jgi:biofilm PGA synthesis lipoprotein PgaB
MRWLLPLLFCWLQATAAEPALQTISFHDVRDQVAGDLDPDQYAVSTARLISYFTWLRDNGYTPVSIDQVMAARAGREPLPPNAVLLTFDDGLVSVYERVLPLLKLFDYPAVVSVVTSWIDNDVDVPYANRRLGRADFLSWKQIRELRDSGLVEIASHSHDLHRGVIGNPQGNDQPAAVTRVFDGEGYESENAYRERIAADFARSVSIIEQETGHAPRVITWPYGAYNDIAAEVARDHGMPISLTLEPETTSTGGSLNLGRYLVMSNPTLGDFSGELMLEPRAPLVRVAQVDLDYVYDPDPVQQRANLDRLLDRIKALEISHVYLQAFADDDSDGGADALYFPNRHLPMRADLFNRVAWQLKTRAHVRVFAWMPMLSFIGGPFEPDWRVLQHRDGKRLPDPNSEPRLSPYNEEARALIGELYEDLAVYANFDGLLFHDDGRLNEFEDVSDTALAAYEAEFGSPVSPDAIASDPDLQARIAHLNAQTMIDMSEELAARVRRHLPAIRTVRNIFSGALLDPAGMTYLAQDYDAFLETYDYVALLAMPRFEGASDAREFYERLVEAVAFRDSGLERTVFVLQTVDWNTSTRIATDELLDTMRWLLSQGVRNLGYYPDDFIFGHPEFDELRRGLSLADLYGESLP